MPTSKKQLTKLNQVKKAKAEELSKQAAAGSKDAKKKLKKLENICVPGLKIHRNRTLTPSTLIHVTRCIVKNTKHWYDSI